MRAAPSCVPRSGAALRVALLHATLGALLLHLALPGGSGGVGASLRCASAAPAASAIAAAAAAAAATAATSRRAEEAPPPARPPAPLPARPPVTPAAQPPVPPAARPPAPLPSSSSSCVAGPLPRTTLAPVSRGHGCFENLFIVGGRAKVFPPRRPEGFELFNSAAFDLDPRERAVFDFLAEDAGEAQVEEMSEEEAAALAAAGPLPSVAAAHVLFEWRKTDFLRHHMHFSEAILSQLYLEAVDELPVAEVVLVCGHAGARIDDGLNGQRGLNALVAAAIWDKAPLARCEEVNGTFPGDDRVSFISPASEAPSWEWRGNDLARISDAQAAGTPLAPLEPPRTDWCARAPGALPRGRLPPAMHIARACASDRKAAHRDKSTQALNNMNAALVARVESSTQERIESALASRMRTSPLVAGAIFAPDVKDLTGEGVAETLARPALPGEPLVLAIQRSNRRSFRSEAFADLVALLRAKYSRVLAVALERFSPPQQLQLATQADIIVGAHGMGLSSLLWMKRGSGVLEIFPHFVSEGVHGTAWTNDNGFLSRLKGVIYRAVDCERGHQNPVGHKIADFAHQLHIDNLLLNISLIEVELDDLTAEWRAVQANLAAGRKVDMTNHWNPHAFPELTPGKKNF